MNTQKTPKYRRSVAWRSAACALLEQLEREPSAVPAPGRQLTRRQRTYLRWYYLEGLTQQKIADRAGRNLANVSRCLARGERHMDRAMEEQAEPVVLDTGGTGG